MSKKVFRTVLVLAVLGLGFFAVRETLDALKPPPPVPHYQFLVLGDSTSVPRATPDVNRWPQQLQAIFVGERHQVEKPAILAKTGMGIEALVAAVAKPEFQGPYDLVLVQIGADDIVAGMDQETYRVKFSNLLIKAMARVGNDPSRVIVLSIPDWTAIKARQIPNREAVKKKIEHFNAINSDASANAGVRYVDIIGISRQVAFDVSFLSDNLQSPSGRMYEIWARKIYPTALTALGL